MDYLPELFSRYPNCDEVYSVTIVYLARFTGGDVHLNGEHTDWRWFAPEDIPKSISPPIMPVVEQFKCL